ncbi:MAG: hypothetical protein AABN95_16775 [Acidobacteriota bacterium]
MKITEYVLWAIIHLGAWLLMLLASFGAGNLFLRKLKFQSLIERLVFTVTLGLGLCSLALFVMGLIGILYPTVILVLTLLGALATVLHLLYSQKRYLRGAPAQLRENCGSGRWKRYCSVLNGVWLSLIVIALCYWALLLLSTQYPPVQWDAISNHLVLAREYLTQHRLVVVPGIPQPVLPILGHMLFVWALALKDDILAQMIQHTFLMLTALGLYSWGARQNQRALGFAAAAFWLTHPTVLWLSSSAYIDIGLTCFVFLGIYSLRIFWDCRDSYWWYLSLALLSMAAGTKLTGLFFLGITCWVGFLIVVTSFIRSRFLSRKTGTGTEFKDAGRVQSNFNLRSLVLGAGIVVLIAMPWNAFIGYQTGNPVWPMFPEYSQGRWAAPWIVSSVDGFMQHGAQARSVRTFVMLPVDWVYHPERFFPDLNLALSPLIIVWPLAWIVSIFNRSVRWWTLWALAFTVFWFFYAQAFRYWLPALPLVALALSESIQWILGKIWKLPAFHRAAWMAGGVLIVIWGGLGFYPGLSARGLPPVTPDDREAYLSILGAYGGVRYVNKHAAKDDKVCVFHASWMNYYFQPEVIDLRGALYQNRVPTFRWPNDEMWVKWLDFQNVKWIFIYYPDLSIAKENPVMKPFWPDFQLVYADGLVWVFRRKPVPPEISLKPESMQINGWDTDRRQVSAYVSNPGTRPVNTSVVRGERPRQRLFSYQSSVLLIPSFKPNLGS